MKKKQLKILEKIEITGVADRGIGYGKFEGKIIFADQTVPGDIVDVQLTKSKKDYAQGFPVLFHEKSKLRVEPFCNHFGTCGGCTWQNVSYETQLEFKSQLVKDAFRRIGKIESPQVEKIIASPHSQYYRNKLEFTFTNSGYIEGKFNKDEEIEKKPALGFHVRGQFAHVFDIQHCYLQPSPSNEIRLAVKSYATVHQLSFYDLRNRTGYLRNLIIRNTSLNDLMVIVVVAENKPDELIPLLEHIKNTFPEITSLYYCVNTKMNDVIHDLEINLYSGNKYIVEQINDIKYHLGPKSFFQTNIHQARNLYHTALQFAEIKPTDIVYDFYSGLGSIALLASNRCKKVIGVENVEAAVEEAKLNAQLNNISNCEFIYGDMEKIFNNEFTLQHGKANIVITDPPRAGMHKDVCLKLLEMAPEKIVYISCNPATQARDVLILSDKYVVTKLQPVDMFPQTYHVENIALLNLK